MKIIKLVNCLFFLVSIITCTRKNLETINTKLTENNTKSPTLNSRFIENQFTEKNHPRCYVSIKHDCYRPTDGNIIPNSKLWEEHYPEERLLLFYTKDVQGSVEGCSNYAKLLRTECQISDFDTLITWADENGDLSEERYIRDFDFNMASTGLAALPGAFKRYFGCQPGYTLNDNNECILQPALGSHLDADNKIVSNYIGPFCNPTDSPQDGVKSAGHLWDQNLNGGKGDYDLTRCIPFSCNLGFALVKNEKSQQIQCLYKLNHTGSNKPNFYNGNILYHYYSCDACNLSCGYTDQPFYTCSFLARRNFTIGVRYDSTCDNNQGFPNTFYVANIPTRKEIPNDLLDSGFNFCQPPEMLKEVYTPVSFVGYDTPVPTVPTESGRDICSGEFSGYFKSFLTMETLKMKITRTAPQSNAVTVLLTFGSGQWYGTGTCDRTGWIAKMRLDFANKLPIYSGQIRIENQQIIFDGMQESAEVKPFIVSHPQFWIQNTSELDVCSGTYNGLYDCTDKPLTMKFTHQITTSNDISVELTFDNKVYTAPGKCVGSGNSGQVTTSFVNTTGLPDHNGNISFVNGKITFNGQQVKGGKAGCSFSINRAP